MSTSARTFSAALRLEPPDLWADVPKKNGVAMIRGSTAPLFFYRHPTALTAGASMQRVWNIVRSPVQTFLAGLFTVLPLAITVAIVIWVAGILDDYLGPGTVLGRLLAGVGLQLTNETFAYAVGWVLVLAGVYVVGLLVELGAQRVLRDRVDAAFARVPLLGGIYGTVRQLVGMMDTKGQADLKGMQVVFCLFGGESGAAFLALLPTPELFRVAGIDYHAILIPSAPVPVGGSLIFVPAKSVVPANLSVDAFMSIYVSMGVTGPQFLAPAVSPSSGTASEAKVQPDK
jgi:uncharacterized membrane protein